MAESGRFVITDQSPVGVYGYTEPPNVCWEASPGTEVVVNSAALAKAVKEKPIAVTTVDVNGDQLPDQFSLVPTQDKFLLLLHRGAVHHGTWENCGGGSNTYNGFELKPKIVGAISRDVMVHRLLGRLPIKDKKSSTVVIEVHGERLTPEIRGSGQKLIWSFKTVPCPKNLPDGFGPNCP